MAFLKPQIQQDNIPKSMPKKPIISLPINEKSNNTFVFTAMVSKKKAVVLMENQLTLFDVKSA